MNANRGTLLAISLLFLGLSFPALAVNEPEIFLLQLLSGEAKTDGAWLAYELESRDRDIRLLSDIWEVSKFTGPPGKIRENELALEHSKARKKILEAKQAGNASKLKIILALTDALKAEKPLDATDLEEPTKVFMQARVAEADARLATVKAEQNHRTLDQQQMEFLRRQGLVSESELTTATDKLTAVNTIVAEAEAQSKLAHDLYAQLVKEKP